MVDLGTVGATYPIQEQDALVQIQNKLKQYDFSKFFTKQRFLDSFHKYERRISTDLPAAKEHKIYRVNMTYTLPYDIPDGKGGILYPKGYTFNPLDYIKIPFVYVIINAEDKKQIVWFRKSKYYNEIKSMPMIVKGDVLTLQEQLKIPVFYADKRIVERFQLKAVPSIAYQKGDDFYVEEIPVKH
jgi:conjugal transfer pilus assembly protein TraW